MAYIRKLKTGWRAEIERNGVRRSMVHVTKSAAQQWAVAEEAAIIAGSRGQFPSRTLAEAVDRYRKEVTDKKGAIVARADNLRFDAWLRDFPELAGKAFHQITAEDIAAWMHKRLTQVSESSVLREAQQFRPIWGLAIDQWVWAGKSPWKGVKLPNKGHARTRLPTWKEVRLLVRSAGYVTGMAPTSPQGQAVWAYMVSLHTALRSGEVLGMAQSNVDLERRVYRLDEHKTDAHVGVRHVPFTRRAAKLLRVLDDAAKASGRDEYFTVSDQSRDTLWRKVRDRVMIDGLRYHDSRAAALTWLAKRYDVMTLAKISGHVDINELFQSYYRESAQDIAARL